MDPNDNKTQDLGGMMGGVSPTAPTTPVDDMSATDMPVSTPEPTTPAEPTEPTTGGDTGLPTEPAGGNVMPEPTGEEPADEGTGGTGTSGL
ncbi:hypothetical protein A3E41_05100 [Candidatus Woesebacteria bacterium RIFCSPHIGHO2_12_FULL_38_9]|nr:MAG: hypothetical protein A3E41_05100 [Candidatus Woesebacteria bacterium RIFCSPHIGHO2_12_FULL_38_9]